MNRNYQDADGKRMRAEVIPHIDLASPGPDTFDKIAENAARIVAGGAGQGTCNNRTQLRRFYDELCSWADRCRDDAEVSARLPVIRMLRAKVVYAQARGHVDDEYVALVEHLVRNVTDATTLRNARLFMEAFTGFYRAQ